MKTITSKTILMLLTGAFLVLLFNSCTKDPVIPEDETKNKLHEDPAKVTVRPACRLERDTDQRWSASESRISCPTYKKNTGHYL